jgi:ribonuclease D
MTYLSNHTIKYVSQQSQFESVLHDLSHSSTIAIDTEANSRHRYPEQLCLIQVATEDKIYIIDPLALKDLTPLKELLANKSITKVFHTADYDIRSLDRHAGCRVINAYDVGLAARFLGITQFGLASVVKAKLGITINKDERIQRSDWGKRPLPQESLEYAAMDVRHLIPLRCELDKDLNALGRTGWVAEECLKLEEIRYVEPDIETAFFSVKGAIDLAPNQLAILKSIFLFREEVARRLHQPPFYVISDGIMIILAINPTAALQEVPGLGQSWLQRFGHGLHIALHQGQESPPVKKPVISANDLSAEQKETLGLLKTRRTELGKQLSLDPSLIWPLPSLRRLAEAPGTFDAEIHHDTVRQWQRDNFRSSLWNCLSRRSS